MRKLMLAAIGYTAALTAAHYLIPESIQLYFAISLFVIAFAGFFFHGKLRRIILILVISASLGFAWNYAHGVLFINPAEELVGETRRVEALVLDEPNLNTDYATVMLRLRDDELPSTKVLLTDYGSSISELDVGDIVCIDLEFRSARIRYNTEDDYYLSSGIFLRAYLDGEFEVIGYRVAKILNWPQIIANRLKDHILEIFPEDTAALMKALLTGDKTELYEDDELYVSLKLAGLSHVIAVSGMHVSFIISMIAMIGGKRKITAYIGIPLVWFFAAMTGFGPSVTRASLMISLTLLAPILGRENDPPTSLSSALLILLIINPQAIGSISLQLSFAAVAGILLITPSIYGAVLKFSSDINGVIAKFVRGVGGIFASSVGALIFTTPLAAIHFGFVPLYSIFANILCLWAMSAAFMVAYPICVIAAIFMPLGKIIAWLVAFLPRYTILVVKLISKLPYSALYTHNNLFGLWLVLTYGILIIPWLLSGRKPYRPIIPICCCIVSLLATCYFNAYLSKSDPAVTAVDVGQGQCIVATTDQGSVVIDCGAVGSAQNAGDSAAEFLLLSGRRKVDLLILTHLHDDHANGVVRLMNYVDIKRIALPVNCEETEIGDIILQTCYDKGTEIIFVEENTSVFVDNLILDIFAPVGSADPNENGLIILGDYGDFEFLVTGDAGSTTEDLLVSFYPIGDIELLVVGHHGSKYSSGDNLLDATTPEHAFISVGTNSYGHPTEEVLDKLTDRDIKIYRTDISGDITMVVGNTNG